MDPDRLIAVPMTVGTARALASVIDRLTTLPGCQDLAILSGQIRRAIDFEEN